MSSLDTYGVDSRDVNASNLRHGQLDLEANCITWTDNPESFATTSKRPLRVMALRSVTGSGGGAENIILRTAEHADRRRLQMTICAIHRERDLAFDLPDRARAIGAELIPVPQRRVFDPRVFRRLKNIVQSGRFDLIHSHDYKSNYYARRLARRYALPTVSTAHGWTGDLLREKYFYYPIDKWLLQRFDAVIGVSTEICTELQRRGVPQTQLRTILNGVNPVEYHRDQATRAAVRRELSIAEGDIVIGAAGRIEKQKRFDILVEAFGRLAPQPRSLQLIIAGHGTLIASLSKLLHQRGLADRCRLLGHCGHMRRLYHAFDMYVQSSEYEGTPTALVEAMAMELPIVATDVGGTTELVFPDRHALIVPPHDVAALAKAMATTLEDPVATRERVTQARRRVERELSIEYRIARLMDVYSTVVAGSWRDRHVLGLR